MLLCSPVNGGALPLCPQQEVAYICPVATEGVQGPAVPCEVCIGLGFGIQECTAPIPKVHAELVLGEVRWAVRLRLRERILWSSCHRRRIARCSARETKWFSCIHAEVHGLARRRLRLSPWGAEAGLEPRILAAWAWRRSGPVLHGCQTRFEPGHQLLGRACVLLDLDELVLELGSDTVEIGFVLEDLRAVGIDDLVQLRNERLADQLQL